MKIENYINDLLNEHSVNQQYNHGDLHYTRRKIETTKKVLEFWRDYEKELFLDGNIERKRNYVSLRKLIRSLEVELK